MNLGELISALEASPQDNDLRIAAPVALFPGRPESYRGFYADLAIVPEVGWDHRLKVGAYLPRLKIALGHTFEGYKGGDYVMGTGSAVWVSEHGTASGARVVAVGQEVRGATTYIVTSSLDPLKWGG